MRTPHANVRVTPGMSLRDALRAAVDLGLQVQYVHGTGEIDVIGAVDPAQPQQPRPRVRLNSRRKDASRALTGLLRQAARAMKG